MLHRATSRLPGFQCQIDVIGHRLASSHIPASIAFPDLMMDPAGNLAVLPVGGSCPNAVQSTCVQQEGITCPATCPATNQLPVLNRLRKGKEGKEGKEGKGPAYLCDIRHHVMPALHERVLEYRGSCHGNVCSVTASGAVSWLPGRGPGT